MCEVRFSTPATVDELHALLDPRLDPGEAGEWSEVVVQDNGDRLVRGLVRYDAEELVVVTNSVARADRLVE